MTPGRTMTHAGRATQAPKETRRRRRAARATVSFMATAIAGVTGCSADSGTTAGSGEPVARVAVPAPAPVVTVTMGDFTFEYDAAVPSGTVVFRFENRGKAPHRATMIRLPDDFPPIDVQLRGSERRSVPPFAGFYERAPGDTGTFAAELAPATRYALFCSVRDENGTPHWQKGMISEFRTPPASSTFRG